MNKYFLGFLAALVFFIAQFLTLPDYGINWDGPMHMMRGQALAQFYLTGKKTYDIPKRTSPVFYTYPNEYASRFYFTPAEEGKRVVLPPNLLLRKDFELMEQNQIGHTISFYEDESWNGTIFVDQDGPGHLPLVDTLSAISNRIFYQQLNILGDIESYQLVYILFASLGVFVAYLFTFEITESILAALIASVALALFPVFFAEAHFNMKDPIQASLFAGSVWSFWHWVKDNKKRWFILFTIFVAFALGVKWNIIFLPFILLPWLFLIRKTPEFKKWFTKKLFIYIFFFLLASLLFLIAIWPYSWTDPIGRLLGVANFYLDFGGRFAPFEPTGFLLPFGINIFPLLLLLTQTPEILLVLASAGLVGIFRKYIKENSKIGYLLLFWLLVPSARLLVPHAGFYGGVRQFMEIVPAMAIVAGLGFKFASDKIKAISKKNEEKKSYFFSLISSLLFLIVCLFLLIPILRLHPNENAYFNMLTGGIKGAGQNNLIDWSLTFGNVYKQGVNWLNSHAEKNATLAHLDGSNFAIFPIWLRDDISISPDNFSGFEQKGEYIMALYNPQDPPSFAARYPKKFLRPVHTITANGFTLLYIYQNSPKYSLVDLSKRQFISSVITPQKGSTGDYLTIDLGKDLNVIQIVVNAPISCIQTPDDAIALLPEGKSQQTLTDDNTFRLQEKKVFENNQVAFYFPGEKARYVYILPLNEDSCFTHVKVTLVSFLP